MVSKSGLFKPPRHKWLADVVCFETPKCAREAANTLIRALERGRLRKLDIGPKRALQIVRALNYAANRASAAAQRHNLSPKERKELRAIHKIYRRAAEKASKIYKEKYKQG